MAMLTYSPLEAIVGDPTAVAKAGDVQTALYLYFLKVWSSMPVDTYVDQVAISGDEIGARRNLDAMTLKPRIALALFFDCKSHRKPESLLM